MNDEDECVSMISYEKKVIRQPANFVDSTNSIQTVYSKGFACTFLLHELGTDVYALETESERFWRFEKY